MIKAVKECEISIWSIASYFIQQQKRSTTCRKVSYAHIQLCTGWGWWWGGVLILGFVIKPRKLNNHSVS